MPSTVASAAPVRTLLAGAIDYAGLFPPAELDLTRALNEYLAVRSGDERWALGRFIVPARRLPDLAQRLLAGPIGSPHDPLPVAALLGVGVADDVEAVERFSREVAAVARVESVEVKAGSVGVARAVLAAIPPSWTSYLEVPPGADLEPVLDELVAGSARAKLRTGGVTVEAFPGPEAVLDFLEGCARRRLPFKATAGLHHPLRGEYPLTYASAAPRATMYGYLNVLGAAALLWSAGSRAEARAVLLESSGAAVSIGDEGLRIGARLLTPEELSRARTGFIDGFGSCSFREPLDELAPLVRA